MLSGRLMISFLIECFVISVWSSVLLVLNLLCFSVLLGEVKC